MLKVNSGKIKLVTSLILIIITGSSCFLISQKNIVLAAGTTVLNVDFSSLQSSAMGNPFSTEWQFGPYVGPFYSNGYYTYIDKATNNYSSKYPWVKEIQLLSTTGGNDISDLLVDNNNKNSAANYTRVFSLLDNVIKQGAKPLIKLGNVPKAFSSTPDNGEFGYNVKPPDDVNYTAYYNYMYNFINACASRYSLATIQSWNWCVFTEGNNIGWFMANDGTLTSSKNAFCKVYDYTVAALQSVIGSSNLNVGIHFVAVTSSRCWDTSQFYNHVKNETNYYTGTVGSQLNFVLFSSYEQPTNATANQVTTDYNYMKNKAVSYGLNNLRYGVGECWFAGAVESGSTDMWSRVFGSVIQNSYTAKVLKNALDNNIDWLSNPIHGINNDYEGEIDAPFINTLKLIEKMKDGKRAAVTKSGTPATGNDDVNAVSSYDSVNQKMYVLVYNHNKSYTATTAEDLTVNFNNIAPVTGSTVTVKQYTLNEDNGSWWKTWWTERGSTAPRISSVSKYDLCLWGSLANVADQNYFRVNKVRYQGMLTLTNTSVDYPVTNNSLSRSLSIAHHGVTLYEISNVRSELINNAGFESGISPWSNAFGGTVAQTSSQKNTGSYGCVVSGRTSVWYSATRDITSILNTYGQGGYSLTAMAMLSSGSDAGASPTIRITDGEGQHYISFPTSPLNSTNWTLIGGGANITWSGTLTEAILYENTTSSLSNLYLDDFSLYMGLPTITLGAYNTSPTNQDIIVTATTDFGTLNTSSHTFTQNGSFDFIATSGSQSTTTTVIITNIDKTSPIISGVTNGESYKTATISFNEGSALLNGVLCNNDATISANGDYVLIVTDLAGNSSTVNFTIYNISYNYFDGILTGVALNTKIKDLKNNINTLPGETIKIFNNNNFELTDDQTVVGTGMTMQIFGETTVVSTYTIIIYGDVNGEGEIDIADLVLIKHHLLKLSMLQGAYLTAGDIYKRGAISISDLITVKKHILGLSYINQTN